MEGFLKQGTAITVTVLMVSSTDHISGKTGLTLTIYASKAGSAPASISPTVTELDSTNTPGLYKLALTSGHTDTFGELDLHITGTGADPADYKWQVTTYVPGEPAQLQADQAVNVTKVAGTTQTARDLGASVLLSAGTGTGQLDFTSGIVKSNLTQVVGSAVNTASAQVGVNVVNVNGAAQTARDIGLDTKNLAAAFLLRSGTAQAGSTTSITLDSGASASNDFYRGALCTILSGAGAGQSRLIYNYNGGTKVALPYPSWAGTGPDNTSVFQIVAFSGTLSDYIGGLLNFQVDVGAGVDAYSALLAQFTFTGANVNAHLAAGQLFFKKNTALNNFPFVMRDATTHAPKTGLTVSGTRKIDSGSFAATANAVSEIANGWYQINLAATDVNGTTIAFRFTASGADDLDFTVITQA